jgi:hypothetical protein
LKRLASDFCAPEIIITLHRGATERVLTAFSHADSMICENLALYLQKSLVKTTIEIPFP